MKINTFIIILLLTTLAGFLRFYNLANNPVSLSVDEVSIGYNAYSILKTGRDEYNKPYPLTFQSLGDYKPPLYIYMVVPSIAIFGLNEFAVRFPSAFFATLTVPLLYFFLLKFTDNKKYAVLASALLAISPWHIYFSRIGSESTVATTLSLLGILLLMRVFNNGIKWAIPASFVLVLSMYTYHSQRLFIPLFTIIFILLNFKKLNKKTLILFSSTFFIFLIPIIFAFIFGVDSKRAQMTIITNDVNFLRNVTVSGSVIPNLLGLIANFFADKPFLLLFFWIRKFLAYFQPSFLFYNGLGMTTDGTYGLGVSYLFEIPFIILGVIALCKKPIVNKKFILIWVLLGILPASLTLNEQHPIRTMVVLPMAVLISAIGGIEFISFIKNNLASVWRKIVLTIFSGFIVWNLLLAFLIFSIHFPMEKGEGIMEGTKQAAEYAIKNKDKYKEIVFDPVRGVDGPYLVNAPHAYILFYSKYDPAKYQSEPKIQGKDYYSFDKYTIRSIKWGEDRLKKGTLFIGSSWSMPLQDLKEDEILDRIYLTNGKLAFLVVSPK